MMRCDHMDLQRRADSARRGRIHILHLITTPIIGGPGKLILTSAEMIDRSQFQISIASCLRRSENELLREAQARSIPGYRIPMRTTFDPLPLVSLARLLHALEIDIIHTHGYRSNLMALLSAPPAGSRIVATAHGWTGEDHRIRFYERMDRLMLRRMDRVVAVSEQKCRELIRLGITPERIRMVPNAIPLSDVAKVPVLRARARGQWGIPDSGLVVGTVGRLSREKGHHDALLAFPDLLEQIPRATMVIVGDGHERQNLEHLASTLGIDARVVFTGYCPNAAELMAGFDLFVLPSHSEGMPIALLEALGLGLPCVATDVGGVSELVHHNHTGFLVPPRSPELLSRAMIQLLAGEQIRLRLGKAASEFVQEHYSIEARVRREEEMYSDLVSSAGGKSP